MEGRKKENSTLCFELACTACAASPFRSLVALDACDPGGRGDGGISPSSAGTQHGAPPLGLPRRRHRQAILAPGQLQEHPPPSLPANPGGCFPGTHQRLQCDRSRPCPREGGGSPPAGPRCPCTPPVQSSGEGRGCHRLSGLAAVPPERGPSQPATAQRIQERGSALSSCIHACASAQAAWPSARRGPTHAAAPPHIVQPHRA